MTLVNGARGPGAAGDDEGAAPGPAGPVDDAPVPQSEIPTWSGPAVPPSPPPPRRPSGPIPVLPVTRHPVNRPRMMPVSGHPSLPPLPRLDTGPSVALPVARRPEHPPLSDGRRTRAREGLRRRPLLRTGVIGGLALVQAFVLFSAAMWWLEGRSPAATATVAPMTWTGVVHDVGDAGVNMRANPAVADGNAKDVAARGARLSLQCGQTGAVVTREDGTRTATWLRTTDGLWVSMLYVHVPDRASIPSCPGSPSDGPLLALADPTASEQPPPPGTAPDDERTTEATGKVTADGQFTAESDTPDKRPEEAATPEKGAAVGPSGHVTASTTPTTTTTTTDPLAGTTLGSAVAEQHHSADHRAKDPNLFPVG
jgi:hypothetical protein